MGRILNEDEVRAAELMVCGCFEAAGVKKIQARHVIQYAKTPGFHKAEIKEARKRLWIDSKNVEGEQWWIWPDDTEPGEVNKQKSEEFWKVYERKGH